MVAFIQKAHGCFFFCYVIEGQAAQLAISDSCSVLQEQRWNNQGQAVQVLMWSEKKKPTSYLELKKTQ
jgi:hypothetical protein